MNDFIVKTIITYTQLSRPLLVYAHYSTNWKFMLQHSPKVCIYFGILLYNDSDVSVPQTVILWNNKEAPMKTGASAFIFSGDHRVTRPGQI